MANYIDIPEGRTNDYLVHGFFVAVAGLILFLVHWVLTVFMLAVAIALFRVSSGIEIDVEGRRVRVYKAIGSLRLGAWMRTITTRTVAIRYTNESQVMNSRATSTNVTVRTYDLHLIAQDGSSCLLHEFTDYAKARKCAVAMAQGWSLQLTDEVQERRQRAQASAASRRR